jgi:hypothetical protein
LLGLILTIVPAILIGLVNKLEASIAACTGIDHSFAMNNEVVSMKADLKSSVMIPKLIYAKYKHVVNCLY